MVFYLFNSSVNNLFFFYLECKHIIYPDVLVPFLGGNFVL
jgi:hypothetical protein